MTAEFELYEQQGRFFAPTIFLLQELTGAIKGGLRIEEDNAIQRLYFWRQSNSYGLVYLNGRGLAFNMQINERGVKEVGMFEGNNKVDLKLVYTIHLGHSVKNSGQMETIAGENIKSHWDLATANLIDKFVSSFLSGEAEIFAPQS